MIIFRILIISLLAIVFSNLYAQDFYLGVDLSYVNELEDNGAIYYNEEAKEQDVYEILANKGANLVRLRLWHNPQWTNYSNTLDITKAIERAKNRGQKVLLDFHYSDFWADPGRQWCPKAWNDIDNDSIMGDSVFSYTYTTLKNLANKDLLPEMVQIGNETNGNILIKRTNENIDDGSPNLRPINWERQVLLFHRGIDAVKQINVELSTDVKTVIHIAQPENAKWWFDAAVANGLEGFDIIGLSYYPEWSDMSIREVGENIQLLKQEFQKDVMIVETGYPWTTSGNDNASNILGNSSKMDIYNNTLSNEVQRDFLIELSYLVKENGGIGLIYWEPAWVSSDAETYWGKGSHYENVTLFDFDNKVNIGADYLFYDYSQKPKGLLEKDITFRVNMTGQETQNGVFITGDFTGEDWEFIEMSQEDNNWYGVTTSLPGRSVAGYIFYNNNVWDDMYRETLPSSCANMWDTHRKVVVQDAEQELAYKWSACNAVSNTLKTEERRPNVFPSPASNLLYIKNSNTVQNIELRNSLGQLLSAKLQNTNCVDVSGLKAGPYFITISTQTGTYTRKFIKN